MKTIIIALGAFLFAINTSSAQTCNIRVTIYGIDSNKGSINIGLFNNKNTFPIIKKIYKGKIIASKKGELMCVFENIPIGKYAVSVFHDVNKNQILDKNIFGKPIEQYAFSRNKYGIFGPPDFSEVAFDITDKTKSLALKIFLN